MDIFFLQLHRGLLIIDIPANDGTIIAAIAFFLFMYLLNFVLGILKRIPFL